MRHSTADPRVPTLTRPGCGLPPLVHRPQGHDERSTTFAHPPRSSRLDPARRGMPATRAVAWPRRSHRRVHRRADPPLHDRARARRAPAGPLQDAPRLPVRGLRRGLPGRHLPAHPGRADRRQRRPSRGRRPPNCVRHPYRAVVRSGSRSARAGSPGVGLPSAPERPILPSGVRLSCNEKHARDDDRLGEPLCPDCYDYTGAVLFNARAPELWRRFTITLRRKLARRAGLTGKAFAAQVRLSYAKVAEDQRRGVVHFHAIVRLDGAAGPASTPPAWATLSLLTDAIGQAVRAVQVRTPAAPRVPSRPLTWGGQLDVRPVTPTGELTDSKVLQQAGPGSPSQGPATPRAAT